MSLDDATRRQVQAAEPGNSTWLTANAGSGKTRVLTDRVARLLLDGVNPQHILCLTYTKAAASEMQNRLFQRLGEWALMADARLADELDGLGAGDTRAPARLAEARRLFARAIETPGGLRIQTIHSFCASLLRRFPLEAGVSPQFTEMDERAGDLLRDEVASEIAEADPDAVFSGLLKHLAGDDLRKFTDEILRHRAGFAEPPDRAALAAWFGLPPGTDEASIVAEVFDGSQADLVPALVSAMDEYGSSTDRKASRALSGFDWARPGVEALEACFAKMLYGASAKAGPFTAKIGAFPTKATAEAVPELMPGLEALMRRVEAAREPLLACRATGRAFDLHRFARRFIERYEARKQALARLDFDDLITRTLALLSTPEVAAWVLYRLDGGIDHILVDEAQDTSPEQWQVIARLAQEFTAGESARSSDERTIFVVGDPKQSIYSFQGADAAEFARMKAQFGARLREAGPGLRELELAHSFRSAPAILRVVDLTFPDWTRPADGHDPVAHIAFHGDLPGRVDLWPMLPKPDTPEPPEWYDPVDRIAANDNRIELAHMVAKAIGDMIGQPLPDGKGGAEPIRPGHILVLVQRRSDLFHEIIRACKKLELPVAGADRLKLGGELAVRDLTALMSFLATQDDSLSLAAALRSPLFGWSEDALFRLAHGRAQEHLWPALRAGQERWPETLEALHDLRDAADFLRPYDLLERVLIHHGGRRKLLARLGPEAEEGIDAMLAQALAFERSEVPSLTGFITWLAAEEVEIKRQMDSAGDRIRVMTVHGAKGLESEIVFLPDSAGRRRMDRGEIVPVPPENGRNFPPLWKVPSAAQPARMAAALETLRQADDAERRRLLYVAMTRAKQWLIVCGAEVKNVPEGWHGDVRRGMEAAGAVRLDTAAGEGLRVETGNWSATAVPAEAGKKDEAEPLPDWARRRATPAAARPGPINPSKLPGDKVLPGEPLTLDADEPLRRGRQIHLLLEHLPHVPPEQWVEAVQGLLATGPDAVTDAAELDRLAEDARRVLEDAALRPLFTGEALAEIDLTAPLAITGGRPMLGTVDRLILRPEHVLAIDYKTNVVIPGSPEEVPAGLLAQMGAYQAALSAIYPDRAVEVALLWTAAPQLMTLPNDLVMRALAAACAP